MMSILILMETLGELLVEFSVYLYVVCVCREEKRPTINIPGETELQEMQPLSPKAEAN